MTRLVLLSLSALLTTVVLILYFHDADELNQRHHEFAAVATKSTAHAMLPESIEQDPSTGFVADERLLPGRVSGQFVAEISDYNPLGFPTDPLYFEKHSQGVSYTDIANSRLSKHEIEKTTKALENLRRTGSFSGGKVTHEFSDGDYYKKRLGELGGERALRGSVTFEPTALTAVLGEAALIGADVVGDYKDGRYNSLYRLYEFPSGRKLEMGETYAGDGTVVFEILKEALNYNIDNVPMIVESLKSEDGKSIYNVTWVSGSRHYAISALGYPRTEAMALVAHIIRHPAPNPLSSQRSNLESGSVTDASRLQ